MSSTIWYRFRDFQFSKNICVINDEFSEVSSNSIFSNCGLSMHSPWNHNVSVKMISGSIVGRAIDAEKTDSNFQNCFNQQRAEYISINRYILGIVFVNFIILVNSIWLKPQI